MTFTFHEMQYRIVFRHEKPRDWSAHYGHNVLLSSERFYCHTCKTAISGIGPAAARLIKAAGRDSDREIEQLLNGMSAGVAALLRKRAQVVRRMIARDLARDVTCTIYERVGEEWKATSMVGHSRLNTDAGDAYNREQGRIAALRAALPKPIPGPPAYDKTVTPAERERKDFASLAIWTYLNRKRGEAKKAGGR